MRQFTIVLCFVALLILIIPVSATEDSFYWSGFEQTDLTKTGDSSISLQGLHYTNYLYLPNVEITGGITSTQVNIPVSAVSISGGDGERGYDTSVTFKIGTTVVGTGVFGYQKNLAGTEYIVSALIWNMDLTDYTGAQQVSISDSSIGIRDILKKYNPTWSGSTYDTVFIQYEDDYGQYILGRTGCVYKTDIYYSYYNYYDYSGYNTHNYFDMNRTVGNPNKATIEIGGIEVVNESLMIYTDLNWLSYDLDNSTWELTVENIFGDVKYKTLTFTPTIIASVGHIELNQTSYTEPEQIQINAELITYDFTGHSYKIEMERLTDSGSYEKVTNILYNESTTMDTVTKSIYGDINFYSYEIPLKIRAVLKDYNKNTGITTTIATSNTVLFNPPLGAEFLVSGIVVDADTSAVVGGATVSVTGPMEQWDYTDTNGRFYLYLESGTYTFNTTKSGYENNVDTGIVIDSDTSGIEIPLVPVQTDEGVVYGTITDSDTKNPLNDVHVIFTNTTDTIHAYSESNGYYEAEGFNNDSVYAVRALKTGYYSYNGSITTETSGATHKSFDMVQTNYSATPTPTSVSTYPGGEGYEWTNDDIVTMLRVLVPGIFLMMLIFLLLAVMMGFMPNNGGNQGGNSGLGELWRRK